MKKRFFSFIKKKKKSIPVQPNQEKDEYSETYYIRGDKNEDRHWMNEMRKLK